MPRTKSPAAADSNPARRPSAKAHTAVAQTSRHLAAELVPAKRTRLANRATSLLPASAPVMTAAATVAPASVPPLAPRTEPALKRKKPKLVRDGFTMPEADYALLGALKKRALHAGREVKKSELLRAGLRALAAMPDAVYIGALEGVERIKPGRPAAD